MTSEFDVEEYSERMQKDCSEHHKLIRRNRAQDAKIISVTCPYCFLILKFNVKMKKLI